MQRESPEPLTPPSPRFAGGGGVVGHATANGRRASRFSRPLAIFALPLSCAGSARRRRGESHRMTQNPGKRAMRRL